MQCVVPEYRSDGGISRSLYASAELLCGMLSVLLLVGCSTADGIPDAAAAVSAVMEATPSGATVVTALQPVRADEEPDPADSEAGMRWEAKIIGTVGEEAEAAEVTEFTLFGNDGVVVKISELGATITSVQVPDSSGQVAEITLNHSSFEQWQENGPVFGATIGRFANRIAGGHFVIGKNVFSLPTNAGRHHIHGGPEGFQRQVWKGEATQSESSVAVTMTYVSKDGEMGYPGELKTTLVCTLNSENDLTFDYTAECDRETILNLTNHTYWNLSGRARRVPVTGHRLWLLCDRYLEVDEDRIPTGSILAVAGIPLDFTFTRPIGEQIEDTDGGYDHCYVVNRQDDTLVQAAFLEDPESGRQMEVWTTEPGLQLYTANGLNGGKGHGRFKKHHGVCLETQHFPDSPNHPYFPTTSLKPGETFRSTTVHKFRTRSMPAAAVKDTSD